MNEIQSLVANTEELLVTIKKLEKEFMLIPKNQIKTELGIKDYERIVAILEYNNIRTTQISKTLTEDIKGDLLEEKHADFFVFSDKVKLKKQKKADEDINEILELAKVFGLEIKRDKVTSTTTAKDAEEHISTNKVLNKARKELYHDEYMKLRKLFETRGWILVEEDTLMSLEENSI